MHWMTVEKNWSHGDADFDVWQEALAEGSCIAAVSPCKEAINLKTSNCLAFSW
jgi:hypothetical protein